MPTNASETTTRHSVARLDMKAAMLAGVVAAVVATLLQLLLWWIYALPLPETLFRDARLAAAIVLGPDVLSPPSSFDWRIMAVATGVHFALSMVYAFVLAAAVTRLPLRAAIAVGAVFGLGVYALNLYGFTWLFPWFAITRDGITIISHVVFGVTASATYIATRRRPMSQGRRGINSGVWR